MEQFPESFETLVTPAISNIVARQIGEPTRAVAKGFRAAIPIIGVTIADRCKDPDFLGDLTDVVRNISSQPYPLSDIGRLDCPEPGIDTTTEAGRWLLRLFGQNI